MDLDTIYTGLFVGILFGFALQRGRFCMNSAFRDIILFREFTLLKAVGIALLVQMVGFTVLAMSGVIELNPAPLLGLANVVGSFVFGVGMVLAGGCASGITYRVGEGMVGAMTAVMGLVTGILMTSSGTLKTVMDELLKHQPEFTADVDDLVVSSNKGFTLANVFGVSHAVMALGIAVVVVVIWGFFAWRNRGENMEETESYPLPERIFKRGWNWLFTGVAIGLIGMLGFWLSYEAGRAAPLGITGGYKNIFNRQFGIGTDPVMDWVGMLIIGTILGSLIAAYFADELKLRAPSPNTLVMTFVGGLLMGFGAVCSGGCNIGHILSGVPQLSLGSILAGTAIILGGWVTSYVIFILPRVHPN